MRGRGEGMHTALLIWTRTHTCAWMEGKVASALKRVCWWETSWVGSRVREICASGGWPAHFECLESQNLTLQPIVAWEMYSNDHYEIGCHWIMTRRHSTCVCGIYLLWDYDTIFVEWCGNTTHWKENQKNDHFISIYAPSHYTVIMYESTRVFWRCEDMEVPPNSYMCMIVSIFHKRHRQAFSCIRKASRRTRIGGTR